MAASYKKCNILVRRQDRIAMFFLWYGFSVQWIRLNQYRIYRIKDKQDGCQIAWIVSKNFSQACYTNCARRDIITAQISALRKHEKFNVELSAPAAIVTAAASAVPVTLHLLSIS